MKFITLRAAPRWLGLVSLVISLSAWQTPTIADDDHKKTGNIVVDLISAPVVADGIVANAPMEFNLILSAKTKDQDFALDPARFGHQIPAGGRMEVELSGAFNIDPALVTDPSQFLTNAHIILTSGPQNPIHGNAGDSVQLANWSAALTPFHTASSHLITVTPNGGQGKNGLENDRAKEIGVKVVHVRPGAGLTPFTNGPVGSVGTVAIRIYDASNKLLEAGVGDVMFRDSTDVGPQVYITNQGVRTGGAGAPQPLMEVNENTNFQQVAENTALTNTTRAAGTTFSQNTPYAPRFFLFNPDNSGIVGSYVVDGTRPWLANLFEGGTQIGTIVINGPSEASRGTILADPGTASNILSVPVQVGSKNGIYTVTVRLIGGGESVNTIIVGKGDDD